MRVVGAFIKTRQGTGTLLESVTVGGESPVQVTRLGRECHLSRAGHVESCLNLRRPCRKAKYNRKTDSVPVP